MIVGGALWDGVVTYGSFTAMSPVRIVREIRRQQLSCGPDDLPCNAHCKHYRQGFQGATACPDPNQAVETEMAPLGVKQMMRRDRHDALHVHIILQ